jgi:glutamine amidotransferase PdxT
VIADANVEALEIAIAALDGLTNEHAAIVEHARTLARAIDGGESVDVKLHGEYRQVCKVLIEVGKKRDLDEAAKILERLRGTSAQ